jgi:Flp pilus assembly protein TadG
LNTSRRHNLRPRRKARLSFRRRLRGERGAAIVEFALILPFLCLFIILILDFGRAFNYWITTTHLASEGARLAAVDSAPGGDLQDFIRSKAGTGELRDGDSRWITAPIAVCVNPGGTGAVGDPVEVTVTTTYHFLPIGSLPGFNDLTDMEIHGSATMRREVVANNVSPGCG